MPLGPGKYGARAGALLLEVPEARIVCVITIGARPEDSAFDVAMLDPRFLPRLPLVLRRVADDIERQERTTNN